MTWTGAGVLPCRGELVMGPPCQGGQVRDLPCPPGDWVKVLPCLDSCPDGQGWGLPCQGGLDLVPVPCQDSGLPCPGVSSVPWECCQDVRMAPLVLGPPGVFQGWTHDEDCQTLVQLGWSFQKRRLALARQVPLVLLVPLDLLAP